MISVAGLGKTFQSKSETVHAIRDVSFEVAAGEIVTLLGPSGCGKTTTLRCVAGLEKPSAGSIFINDRAVVDSKHDVFVPPHRRNLGMVFQSYAIWPHMNVLENVAYALEGRGMSKPDMRAQAMQALDTVQMAHLSDRPAPRLSGGQQQRVAIARALVGRPQALLFDEPLSNLDAKLRMEMRKELRRLQLQIGLTSIYVTHDQSEALAISDWIILMKDGQIVERGRPVDIYRWPKKVFTAQFLGATNLFPGTLVGKEGQRARVQGPHGDLVGVLSDPAVQIGAAVQVSVRPEAIGMASSPGASGHDDANQISGRLELAVFAGNAVEAEVRVGETKVLCLLDHDADLKADRDVVLTFAAEDTLVLADD
jgi:iron(III) transport system ATP-binding protein